ncbi:hypothetical protein D9M69_409610 [compost metagenome]
MTWREQDFTGALVQTVLDRLGNRPVIVLSRADDKLHLIVGREQLDVFVAVAVCFLRTRGFQVDNATDPGIYCRDIDGATGFQRHFVTGVTQALEQGNGVGLCQGLAARDADITRAKPCDLLEDVVERANGPAGERVGAVAVLATQRATGQTHKNSGQAGSPRFTLQRVENFGDSQCVLHSRHGRNS